MEGVEIVKVDVFKCLRSTMESKRAQVGWSEGDECSEACCHVWFTDGGRCSFLEIFTPKQKLVCVTNYKLHQPPPNLDTKSSFEIWKNVANVHISS